jgi:hypothetical protein
VAATASGVELSVVLAVAPRAEDYVVRAVFLYIKNFWGVRCSNTTRTPVWLVAMAVHACICATFAITGCVRGSCAICSNLTHVPNVCWLALSGRTTARLSSKVGVCVACSVSVGLPFLLLYTMVPPSGTCAPCCSNVMSSGCFSPVALFGWQRWWLCKVVLSLGPVLSSLKLFSLVLSSSKQTLAAM